MHSLDPQHIKNALEKRERKEHLIDELTAMYYEDTVNIKLDKIEDIFCSFDPAGAETRSLDSELEAYIIEQLEHFSTKTRVQVNIMVPTQGKYNEDTIRMGFFNHFKTRAEEQLIINRKENHRWSLNLIFGLLFLALCLIVAHICNQLTENIPFMRVLGESFGIIGWVALWEPATYFLYGNREGLNKLKNYMRLHRAKVNVIELDTIHI